MYSMGIFVTFLLVAGALLAAGNRFDRVASSNAPGA